MIKIPTIANDEQVNYNNLGSEFSKMISIDRDRNLINPIRTNPPVNINQQNTDYYYDGIANQGLIFQNNYDIKENQLLTTDQQQKILNELSLQRPYTADEMELNVLQNFDLDPQIRNLLVQESTRNKDNIYAQESQDFVKQVQKDLASFEKEKNLYKLGIDPLERITSQIDKQEKEQIEKIKKEIPGLEKENVIEQLAKILQKVKKLNIADALLEANKIIQTPKEEAIEKLAKKRAVEETITRQRAGVKNFKPTQEERIIPPLKTKDEL